MPRPLLEREAKFEVSKDFTLPDFHNVITGVVAEPPIAQRLTTEYFDTSDLRLARFGSSLRFRKGEGWTVKLPQGTDGALLARTEHTFEGAPDKPPAAALELVRGYVRRARVRAIARLITARRTVELRSIDGGTVAKVVDDSVRVRRHSTSLKRDRRSDAHAPSSTRFREIEVELTDAAPPKLLRAVAKRLRGAGAGSVDDPTPKIVRALRSAVPLPLNGAAQPLDECFPASTIVRHAIEASAQRLVQYDPLIRADFDMEAVHQARVATRRLRSDLKTFDLLLDKRWAGSLRSAIRRLGQELGAVRDIDVLIARLKAAAEAMPGGESEAGAAVARRFDPERDAARAALLAELSSERYINLLDRVVEAGRKPKVTRAAAKPAIDVLPPVFDDQWKQAKKAGTKALSSPTDDNLHQLRIRAKQCRYAADTVAPIAGKPAKAFARAARNLQDMLGEYRDAMTAHDRLRRLAANDEIAFAAGELAANELRAAKKARKSWPEAWDRLQSERKRFSKWR